MSARIRDFLGVLHVSVLGLVLIGCAASPEEYPEDEDVEARAMRTEMLKHRARLEPKLGMIFTNANNRFENSYPIGDDFSPPDDWDMAVGVKGQLEAVQKGMWFGLEFNYIKTDSESPVLRGTPEPSLLVAETEDLMKTHDRYNFLFTWDYDIPLGPDLYHPSFRFGLGLGGVIINPSEADGNTLLKFDEGFQFLARPTVGFRFPLHENFGVFIEANYDFIPELQFSGRNKVAHTNVDIGDPVEFSSVNVWAGLSFEW